MFYEGIVSTFWWREDSILRESIIRHLEAISFPLHSKWRIRNYSLELHPRVVRLFESITIFYIEVVIPDIVHDEIHTSQIVGRMIHLLSIEIRNLDLFPDSQEK